MTERFRGPVVAEVHEDGEITYLEEDKPKKRRKPSGLVYMQIPLGIVASVLGKISPTQARIVDVVLSDYRDGQPWARMTGTELATEVGVTVSNFYKAQAPLRKAGILLRPSSTMWQINPRVGWRGSRASWEQALKIAPELKTEALARG